eukprot:1676462-Heterocapsa_arctica.AAC.1
MWPHSNALRVCLRPLGALTPLGHNFLAFWHILITRNWWRNAFMASSTRQPTPCPASLRAPLCRLSVPAPGGHPCRR